MSDKALLRLALMPLTLFVFSEVEVHGSNNRTPVVLIIADGTGGQFAADGLRRVLAETGTPIRIDAEAATLEGACPSCASRSAERLVEKVHAYRRSHPGRIVLLGYSAGAAVALLAGERLPHGSVDRVILLAAPVSNDYDLRGALRSSREGIDSFYSERDHLLADGGRLVGTSDRKHVPAGGVTGFRGGPLTPFPSPPGGEGKGVRGEPALYQQLRQYGWSEQHRAYDHHGGHFGWTQPRFMQAFVVPLLLGSHR